MAHEDIHLSEGPFDRTELPPRIGKRGVTAHPRAMDAERRTELRKMLDTLRSQVAEANAPELTPTGRIDKLLSINTTVIISLLGEALAENPDTDRASIYGRALTAVKDTVSMVSKQVDLSNVDTFNPRSPKFQTAFGWFCEMFNRIAAKYVDDNTLANLFSDFVNDLAGWEDRLERQFKGVVGASVVNLENPFVSDFRERMRQSTIQLTIEMEAVANATRAGMTTGPLPIG